MNDHIICILVSIIMLIIGWLFGRRQKIKDAVNTTKIIGNLEATISVYKITADQIKTHETNVLSELKIDNYKLIEENKDLKAEIDKLKEIP